MVADCEAWQTNQIDAPKLVELVLAGVARWPMDEATDWHANPVYSTWCDRCGCDHTLPLP